MTTTDAKVLHSRGLAQERAVRGAHAPLIVAEAPAAASIPGTAAYIIGKPLNGLVLTIDGDYHCLIPLSGLASSLQVHFKATLDSMTVDSSGPDQLLDFNPRVTNVADAVVMTAGTGDGSVSTGVRQTASLTLTGALYARYTLTLAGSPTSVTVTEAEYTGL